MRGSVGGGEGRVVGGVEKCGKRCGGGKGKCGEKVGEMC